ncbi:MAG: alkaline phosphatase family protein [Acidobacteriota bacterium]
MPDSSKPLAAWPLCLVASLLLPLPLLLSNSDFARGVLDHLEIFGLSLFGTAFATAFFAGVAKLLKRSPSAGATVGAAIALALGACLVGLAIAGPIRAGVAATLLTFGVVFASRAAGSTRAAAVAVLVTAALGTTLLSLGPLLSSAPDAPRRQLLVIGLDGATWDIIDRGREAGTLPTFDELVRTGTRGDLDVVEPLISPPIWTTIATGRTPDNHGVKDFWATSLDVKTKRFWQIADERGLTSGVMGYLVTWPPEKEKGFLVPGWMAQGSETFPQHLGFLKEMEIESKASGISLDPKLASLGFESIRYGLTLHTVNRALGAVLARVTGSATPLDRELDGRRLKLYLTTDIFCHLLRQERPELGVFYYSSIDAIEHLFFKFYDPDGFPELSEQQVADYGEAIPRIYEETDGALARILEAAEERADILIVSDHGQEASSRIGERWMTIRTSNLLDELDIHESVRATNIGPKVFVRSAGEQEAYDAALARLLAITTADDRLVFRYDEHADDEVTVSVAVTDIAIEETEVVIEGRSIPASRILSGDADVSGVHTTTALFLMKGRGVRSGAQIPRSSVLDVAPTILARLGIPVPRDMEGRVIKEAFEEGSLDEIVYVDTYGPPEGLAGDLGRDIDAGLREKLESLGYIQ